MKKLLLALSFTIWPTIGWAQCTGVFPANTLCGNLSGSPQPPAAFSSGGTIAGPTSSFVGDLAVWNNTLGSQLTDPGKTGAAITSNYTWSGAQTFSGGIGGNLTLNASNFTFNITGVGGGLWTGTSANDVGGGGTNVWLGPSAGPQNAGAYSSNGTLGGENIAIGLVAGSSVTTGAANVMIGGGSGTQITTGGTNTDIGRHSQRNNHAGNGTVAVGEFANNGNEANYGTFAMSASTSSFVLNVNSISGTPILAGMHVNGAGISAGACGITSFGSGVGGTGTYNLDCNAGTITNEAMTVNLTDASNSVFVGVNAGYYAADPNPGGSSFNQSTGVGFRALQNLTTGTLNTAVGAAALQGDGVNSLTGSFNTAVGGQSMGAVSSGAQNTAVGSGTLANIVTGGSNTAVGFQSGNATTGNNNTLLGWQAGLGLTSGTGNLLLTSQGDPGIKTGNYNTILGGVFGLPGNLSNSIILSDGQGTVRADYGKTTSSWTLSGGPVAIPGVAIASLPTCNSQLAGSFATVTNGTSPISYMQVVSAASTSSYTVPVFCGTNPTQVNSFAWVYH